MKTGRTAAIIYESIMLIVVTVSVVGIFIQSDAELWRWVHRTVWIIFLIDVTIRFAKAFSKWQHLKQNPFDIISIIPLEDFFLFARFARLIKLFRYKNIIKRYLTRLGALADKTPLRTITGLLALSIGLTGLIIGVSTKMAITDALIWIIRHTAQFNYQSDRPVGAILLTVAIVFKSVGLLYIGLIAKRVIDGVRARWYRRTQK